MNDTPEDQRQAAQELGAKVQELRSEVGRLAELVDGLKENLNRGLGRIVLQGLISTLLFIPIIGTTIYVAVRLALRKSNR